MQNVSALTIQIKAVCEVYKYCCFSVVLYWNINTLSYKLFEIASWDYVPIECFVFLFPLLSLDPPLWTAQWLNEVCIRLMCKSHWVSLLQNVTLQLVSTVILNNTPYELFKGFGWIILSHRIFCFLLSFLLKGFDKVVP